MIKCKAIRIKNGKLQILNPQTYYGRTRADKASLLQELFGTKTIKYKKDLKRGTAKQGKGKQVNTKDFNEAVSALVGQGASRSHAKLAVQAAAARGANGFEGLFRGALREL